MECVWEEGAVNSREREDPYGTEKLRLVEYEMLWRSQTTGPAQIRKGTTEEGSECYMGNPGQARKFGGKTGQIKGGKGRCLRQRMGPEFEGHRQGS